MCSSSGQKSVVSGSSEEILSKYNTLMSKLRDGHRRSMFCGLIARRNVNSLILTKMHTRVQDLCKGEGVICVDVWDHFNMERTLYGTDGLQLSSIGKV